MTSKSLFITHPLFSTESFHFSSEGKNFNLVFNAPVLFSHRTTQVRGSYKSFPHNSLHSFCALLSPQVSHFQVKKNHLFNMFDSWCPFRKSKKLSPLPTDGNIVKVLVASSQMLQDRKSKKRRQDIMKRVNWTYIGLLGGLTLITGLTLLMVTLTKSQLKLLFFSLSGVLILAGCISLILSFCYFDEFKGLVLESDDIFHTPILKKKAVPSVSSSSLDHPLPSARKSSFVGSNNMMFLSVPEEGNGWNSRRESGYSLASSCYSYDRYDSKSNSIQLSSCPIIVPMPSVVS